MNEACTDCVLIVEFDPLQRDLIVLTLRCNQYQTVVCEDLDNLREMLHRHQPRVLLIDLYLPGINGLDLVRGLYQEQLLKNCRVIVVSALAFKDVVKQSIDAGVDDFLAKPIRPDVLISRIKRAVEK